MSKQVASKKKKTNVNNAKKLKENIKYLKINVEDLKNKNIRLLAEFDNFKKRSIEN